nr:substrate-binding domain-containing protein [Mucilaginibacter sp. Bleaf8]
MDFVQEVNYKPSSLARSLRTGKTNTIGLLVEDISDPFFSAIARSIEANAYQNGYKIIYSSTGNDTEKARELIMMYRERHVDGYIIVPPEGIEDDIRSLIDSGRPVVQIDRYATGVEADYVVIDNERSAYTATQHLIDNGYKNVAFVTIDSKQPQMADRLLGYQKAIQANGLNAVVEEVAYESSIQAMQQLSGFLDKQPQLDAILFATNYLCVSGLKAMAARDHQMLQTMGIISFDDYELFELHTPSITSISQPTEQIAEHAINLLLTRLAQTDTDKTQHKIELATSFMLRRSSLSK